MQARSWGMQGVRRTPKSAKRSTFSNKMGKNGVFVIGLRGDGTQIKKSTHFGGSAPPKSILATGLLICIVRWVRLWGWVRGNTGIMICTGDL